MRFVGWALGRRRTTARPSGPLTGEDRWSQSHYRVGLGLPVAVVSVWQAQPTPRALAAGAAIAFLGVVVRALAAGQLRKHEGLTTSGVYAITRNPLYLGSVVMAGGFALATHSWVAASMIAGYFAAFYPSAIRREEVRLRARYGE